MRRRTRNLLMGAGVLATLGLLVVAGYAWVGTAVQIDSSMHADFNSTPQDAMEEGTFIQHVRIAPDTLRTPWLLTLRFGAAWIHEESHVDFRWLVQKRLVREGTYRLCFNLAEGEPAQGMTMDEPLFDRRRSLVDVESGLPYGASQFMGRPLRFCRPVSRPFPATVAVELVHDDTLRAQMQRFVGMSDAPMPARTQRVAQADVRDGARTLRLTHATWRGLPMLWISEREPGGGSWRVRRVLDYPGAPINHGVRIGTCARAGERPNDMVVLEELHGRHDINSAWRVDAATADLAPVQVQGLACGKTRAF